MIPIGITPLSDKELDNMDSKRLLAYKNSLRAVESKLKTQYADYSITKETIEEWKEEVDTEIRRVLFRLQNLPHDSEFHKNKKG